MLPARSALTPEPNQGGGILFQKAKLMLFFILKDRGKKCQEEIETRLQSSPSVLPTGRAESKPGDSCPPHSK